MTKYLCILLSLLISHAVFAQVPVDGVVAICTPYPSIMDYAKPTSFKTSNNLQLADASGFYQAEGEKITIYGRIMDADCVPVGDAKIYIWQANSMGYLQYPRNNAKKPKWFDPNFIGTGISNSDNMGRFDFISIMPGSYANSTPHINISIVHPDFKTLSSKIYFPSRVGERILDAQPILNSIKAAQVSALPLKEPGVYVIDITLKGLLKNKQY